MQTNSFKQLMLIVLLFTMQTMFGSISAKSVIPGQSSPSRSLSGKVTSATDGEPLIGATVQVQGDKNGTVTDLDGIYHVDAEKGQILF